MSICPHQRCPPIGRTQRWLTRFISEARRQKRTFFSEIIRFHANLSSSEASARRADTAVPKEDTLRNPKKTMDFFFTKNTIFKISWKFFLTFLRHPGKTNASVFTTHFSEKKTTFFFLSKKSKRISQKRLRFFPIQKFSKIFSCKKNVWKQPHFPVEKAP